jgi:hypothetical protein
MQKVFIVFRVQRVVTCNNLFSATNVRRDCISLEPFSFSRDRKAKSKWLSQKRKKKGRFLAPVPEKSRLQVELDQRHKESPFLALPSAVLALFSAYM